MLILFLFNFRSFKIAVIVASLLDFHPNLYQGLTRIENYPVSRFTSLRLTVFASIEEHSSEPHPARERTFLMDLKFGERNR